MRRANEVVYIETNGVPSLATQLFVCGLQVCLPAGTPTPLEPRSRPFSCERSSRVPCASPSRTSHKQKTSSHLHFQDAPSTGRRPGRSMKSRILGDTSWGMVSIRVGGGERESDRKGSPEGQLSHRNAVCCTSLRVSRCLGRFILLRGSRCLGRRAGPVIKLIKTAWLIAEL